MGSYFITWPKYKPCLSLQGMIFSGIEENRYKIILIWTLKLKINVKNLPLDKITTLCGGRGHKRIYFYYNFIKKNRNGIQWSKNILR